MPTDKDKANTVPDAHLLEDKHTMGDDSGDQAAELPPDKKPERATRKPKSANPARN